MAVKRPTSGIPRRANVAVCGLAVLSIALLPLVSGCKGFFIPVCQANNDCNSTTTTTGTTDTGMLRTSASLKATGGAESGSTAASYLYLADARTNTIRAYSVADGKISSSSKQGTVSISTPSGVAATPNGKLLFAATASGPIRAFTVSKDGTLQALNGGQPAASVPAPIWISTDRSGTLLFVLSAKSPQLYVFHIDASDAAGDAYLSPASEGIVPLDPGKPAQVFTTADNQHVFVTLGTGGVDAFTLDADSEALRNRTHIASMRPGEDGDTAVTADAESSHLFVAESGTGIRVLAIHSDGSLTDVTGSPFARQLGGPSSLVFHSANHTLYAAYSASNLLAQYAVDADGRLARVSSAPFASSESSTALSLDASGNDLVAVGSGTAPAVRVFGIGQTAGANSALASGTVVH